MDAVRQRTSACRASTSRALTGLGEARGLATLAGLAGVLVLLTAMGGDGSLTPVALAAAAVGALVVAAATARGRVVVPLPTCAHPTGVARSVPASTAYWCAVTAPSCPRRPRAPGRD